MVDYGFTVIAPKGKRQFIRILPITLGFPGNTSTSISKEVEWRFNHRSENLVALRRIMLAQRVVKERNLLQL
jgi:hypothetical protein